MNVAQIHEDRYKYCSERGARGSNRGLRRAGTRGGKGGTVKERVIAMSARNTVFGNASAEAVISDRILQIAFAAWRQGNFVEAVDQFSDQFTFTDHALGLEFKDKRRLAEFLAKINEWFPDSERKVNAIFSGEDRVISEWTLTATQTEPFFGEPLFGGRLRTIPICVRGISVVQIKNGKISQWSDYYDQLKSRRYGITAWFTEWI
jgi:steroid delta-isomerase-like uncharacterized protein